MNNLLKILKSKVIDLLFVPTCIGCNKTGEIFCSVCLQNISPKLQESSENIFSVFKYSHPTIRKALWNLKYKNNRDLAQILAQQVYDVILEEILIQERFYGFTKPVMIPIPMYKKHKRRRGYNHAELLCKELSFIDSLSFNTVYDVLYKHRDTPRQATLKNKKERLQNLQGCFAIKHSEKILGRNVILIDDITTTGTTLKEATRVLKKAGVKKVICFAVAH
ncbi:MAG: ComF family protein [Candidatus Pacebacteria bacterium]|nr:ComF family protein [Candidatus Paceibacterota bacterium]